MFADPLAFHNGRYVPAADLTVSFADAGFVFAATATDFCRTYRHRLFRWPDHLARLRHDCHALRIPLPYTDAELTAAATHLAAHHAAQLPPAGDLAVITFATPGPLNHLTGAADPGPPTVGMHALPLPVNRYRRFFAEGVTLAVAGALPGDPLYPVPGGVKHRSRLHWWLAEKAVNDPDSPYHHPGAVPVLLGERGGEADTAVGAVLAATRSAVIRPAPGTVLEAVSMAVVGELCDGLGLAFVEAPLDFRDLCRPVEAGDERSEAGRVTELLLAGSGFGVAGVKRFAGVGGHRDFAWPGPVFAALAEAWSDMVGLDVVGQMLG